MYQLGLAGATPEVPRMSVSLGANRWASRVVVVLQLAAWTAVGIVLLQKGVSSLQKTANADKNVTRLNYTETVANLLMKKINDDESIVGSSMGKELRSEFHARSDGDSKIARTEVSSKKANSVDPNSLQSTGNNHLSGVSRSRNEGDNKVILWNTQNDLYGDYSPNIIKEDDKNNPAPSRVEKGGNELPSESTSAVPNTSTTLSPNSRLLNNGIIKKSANTSESRRNSRLSNKRVGGAAAAAVAMVAVGAVMLILGPAVIVLRALDERRQERRFLKLSGQDDLPPSYEQATLMDEAPRYSTLSLNTILGASSTTVTAVSASDQCDRDRSTTVQEV